MLLCLSNRYDQNNCGAIMTHNFLRILGLTSYGRVQPSPPKGNFQMNFSHRRNHSDIVRSRTIRTEVIQVEEEVKETRADQFAMRSVQNNQFTKAGKELFNLDEKMAKAEAQVRYIKQKTTRQSLTESVTDSLRYKVRVSMVMYTTDIDVSAVLLGKSDIVTKYLNHVNL